MDGLGSRDGISQPEGAITLPDGSRYYHAFWRRMPREILALAIAIMYTSSLQTAAATKLQSLRLPRSISLNVNLCKRNRFWLATLLTFSLAGCSAPKSGQLDSNVKP